MHAAADSGCNESVQQMCEHPNFGRVLVATEVWHCGYTRVMDVLLGVMHS